jgi:hypothetical protein
MRISHAVIYRMWHILHFLFVGYVGFKRHQVMAFRKTLIARNAHADIALDISITLF